VPSCSSVITFIIPAYNEELLLDSTISALHSAAGAMQEPYEIVVVDDASTDSTTSVATRCGARVISVHYRQIAAARNAGAAQAHGDLLLFVDADTRVAQAVVCGAVQAMRSGAVGGGARARFDGRVPIYGRILAWLWLLIQRFEHLASGCFLFCTRHAFEAAGGFDQALYAAEDCRTEPATQALGSICDPAGSGDHVRTKSPFALHLRDSAYRGWLRIQWAEVLQNPARSMVWSSA